ncbi:hypothetical protein GEMRC1_007619 [Eukaryota sp. GEM-RC1]
MSLFELDLDPVPKAQRILHYFATFNAASVTSETVHRTTSFLKSSKLFVLYRIWASEHPEHHSIMMPHLENWLAISEADFNHEQHRLSEEKSQAQSSMIAELIRQTTISRARSYISVGNLESAYTALTDLRDFIGSSSTTLELFYLLALICCYMDKYGEALVHIDRTTVLLRDLASGSSISQDIAEQYAQKVELTRALALFHQDKCSDALPLFIKAVTHEISLRELVSLSEIVVYSCFCALKVEKSEWISSHINENYIFRNLLSDEPLISQLVMTFSRLEFASLSRS